MDQDDSILKDIYNLEGLDFIVKLIEFEQERFDKAFLLGSVYEDINNQFGIFPATKNYPKYFMGDITNTSDKYIFIGINPGYGDERNNREQKFMEEKGLFDGCCNLFEYLKTENRGLLRYFANAKGFLKRLYNIEEEMDWDWFQENFINLELIPYHSSDTNGLRINNIERYKKETFTSLLKIIKYLDPQKPIFITGFPSFEKYLSLPIFNNVISFEKNGSIWKGEIAGKPFIGLPFLNRVRGGIDSLVSEVNSIIR